MIDRFKNGTVYRETGNSMTRFASSPSTRWSIGRTTFPKVLLKEMQTRCDIAGEPVPEHIEDFVDTYTGPTRQLSLRL